MLLHHTAMQQENVRVTRSQTKSANSGSRVEEMKKNTLDDIKNRRATWDQETIAKRKYNRDPRYQQAIAENNEEAAIHPRRKR